MATTARETSQGKEKTPKLKPSTTTTQGKKPSKPSVAGSSTSEGPAVLNDKPSPHYLRPTISSTKDPCIYPKKQESDDESHGRRKYVEKHASSAQLKRTVSANFRQTRFTSPSPRKSTPPKAAASGKITKAWTPKTSKPQPVVTKPVSVKKTTSTPTTTTTTKPKKGSKPSTRKSTNPNTNTTTTPSPDGSETPLDKAEEAKADVEGVGEELTEDVKEETAQVESSPANDQTSVDPPEPELQNSGSGYSSTLTEDPELVPKSLTQDTEEVSNTEETPKLNEQSDNIDHPDESKQEDIVKVEEPEGATGKDSNTDDTTPSKELGDEDTPRKLSFKQGKELDVKSESEGVQRLKFKDRKEDTETCEEKADSENVVLRHQDVQGRRESPAYNDFIEETATKLVGKRKSKVKALVGAFETVINLENDAPQNEGGFKISIKNKQNRVIHVSEKVEEI